jgi:hypothetical protein
MQGQSCPSRKEDAVFRIILGLGGLIMLLLFWPLGLVMLLFALLLGIRANGRKQLRQLRAIRRSDS